MHRVIIAHRLTCLAQQLAEAGPAVDTAIPVREALLHEAETLFKQLYQNEDSIEDVLEKTGLLNNYTNLEFERHMHEVHLLLDEVVKYLRAPEGTPEPRKRPKFW